jgi:hypothetical protein
MRWLAAAACVAACTRTVPPEVVPPMRPGIAIAIYATDDKGYAVVDDRRYVELAPGKPVELADIDPTAPLASVMLESPDLHIGACHRDRVAGPTVTSPDAKPDEVAPPPIDHASPIVRCDATGAPGRHLVRVVYVSTTFAFRASHDVAVVAADRASLTTSFAIPTQARKPVATDADVTVFDGAPGGQRVPVVIAHDRIVLDGSVAVITTPPRTVVAHLRRIFEGALAEPPDTPAQDANWGKGSTAEVWVWLEMPGLVASPGPFHVHVQPPGEPRRDLDIATEGRKDIADTLRLPLWIDPELHGLRERTTLPSTGTQLADRFVLTVFNRGTVAREVWIEERMRPARRRAVTNAWPSHPTRAGDVLRNKLTVPPDGRERVGYTVVYDM